MMAEKYLEYGLKIPYFNPLTHYFLLSFAIGTDAKGTSLPTISFCRLQWGCKGFTKPVNKGFFATTIDKKKWLVMRFE